MKLPTIKIPLSISFASVINAISIPLIAGLLWWLLDRVTDPTAFCPVLEEFKVTQANLLASWRCQPIIMAQLDIAKYVAIGLVGAFALSHLVSVAREAKAGIELATKLGNLKIGGDNQQAAAAGAQHVAEAADTAAEQVALAVDKPEDELHPSPALEWPMNPPAPAEEPQGKGFTAPPGEQL